MRKDFIQANMVLKENEKVDYMLENILPKSVVAELKQSRRKNGDQICKSILASSYQNVSMSYLTSLVMNSVQFMSSDTTVSFISKLMQIVVRVTVSMT